jgi:hypothetical protein
MYYFGFKLPHNNLTRACGMLAFFVSSILQMGIDMRHLFAIAASSLVLATSSMAEEKVGPCKVDPTHLAVDMSVPMQKTQTRDGKPVLDFFRNTLNVSIFIRYSDYAPFDEKNPEKIHETLHEKVLRSEERDEIFKRAGSSIVTVFQHNNDAPLTFAVGNRGTDDALRALAVARELGQPNESAIYFGVDGVDETIQALAQMYKKRDGQSVSDDELKKLKGYDNKVAKWYNEFLDYHATAFRNKDGSPKDASKITGSDMLPHIERYFRDVTAVFDAAPDGHPKIGAYGSGFANFDLEKKLPFVEYFWLSQSTGFTGYKDYLNRGRWSLLQQQPTHLGWASPVDKTQEADFDLNFVRSCKTLPSGQPDVGQWSIRAEPR